ncbi:molybdenum cofactor guanylyltransferase [bacterium]|nr:molybdenum cofactor guanylyltransferase [bacterium]
MEKYAAILLAGGNSSRMGKDKASLIINGVSLLEHSIRIVSPLVSRIIVMLSPKRSLPPVSEDLMERIVVGIDSQPNQGPLQGISDAIPFLPEEVDSVFVLSCDLPFLSTDWLIELKQAQNQETDIVCSRWDGLANPLLALYRKEVLSQAPLLLSAGKRSCFELFKNQSIIQRTPSASSSRVCKDVNLPEEYEKARFLLED